METDREVHDMETEVRDSYRPSLIICTKILEDDVVSYRLQFSK